MSVRAQRLHEPSAADAIKPRRRDEAVVARSPWTHGTQSDITVKQKAANLSGAHGKIISAELEVRYA